MRATALARLLIVEDDDVVRRSVSMALVSAGYDVRAEPNGSDIESAVMGFRPDLVLLDVRLTGSADGFTIGQWIRQAAGLPVLFVTAADALADRLRGFELGADDYLVKPFAMSELLARVHAILRRSGRLQPNVFEVGDVTFDERTRTVSRASQPVELTSTEFELLRVLAREPGRVFSKLQLLVLVWGFADYEPNLVEVHISALRRKLETFGPRLIHTERGRGYMFAAASAGTGSSPPEA